MSYKTILSHLDALNTFAFIHPIYSIKLFLIQQKPFIEIFYFHINETLKLVKDTYYKHNLTSLEALVKNRIFSYSHLNFLYACCRLLKPSVIVETGTGAGISSSFILQALDDNKEGKLYTIDLPRGIYQIEDNRTIDETILVPNQKESGWLIPNNLRDKVTLINGKSEDELPKILTKIEKVDVFFHDSEHTYQNMLWEFNTIWPHLSDKALLVSHDIDWNEAFLDFAKKIDRKPFISRNKRWGFLLKRSNL